MPEEQVLITIRGKDEASKAFRSFADEAKKAGEKVESSFGDKLKSTGKQATKLGKGLSIGVTMPLVAFGAVAVNSAMKAERLENTLEGLAGGADQAAEYITAIKDASLGTISELDALAAANRSLAFGIVQTSDEMAEMTEIAITLGRAQGLTATQAVSDFATALSRNSPMILDNLGLTLKLSDAYVIYAESLGKTAAELTEVEKKEAFRKAALIEGAKLVEDMGGLQDDAAASAERMKAQMSDMTTQIGTSLLPIMQQGLDIVTPLVQKFTEMDPATQKLVVGFGAVAAAAGPLLTVVGKLTSTAGTLINVLGPMGLLGPLGLGVVAVGGLTASFILLNDEAEETEERLNEIAKVLESELLQAYIETEKKTKAAIIVYREMWEGLERVAEELKETSKLSLIAASLTGKQGDAWKEVNKTLIFLSESQEDYNRLVDRWNRIAPDSKHHLSDYTELQWENAKANVAASLALEEQAHWHQLYSQAVKDSYVDLDEHNRAVLESIAASERSARGLKSQIAPARKASQAVRRLRISRQEDAEAAVEHQAALEASGALIVGTFATMESAVQTFSGAAIQAWQSQQGELANLISSLQDATKEQFMQQLLASIDPAQLEGGALEWAKIGEALGLISPEQVKMAEGIEALAKAYDTDVITDTENFAAAAGEIYTWANENNPELAKLPEIIGTYADEIEPVIEPTSRWNDLLEPLGDDLAPKAKEGIENLSTVIGGLPEELQPAAEFLGGLNNVIQEMEGEHDVIINIQTNMSGPPIPDIPGPPTTHQFGGRIPGPVGSPQLVLAHGGEYVLNPHQRGAMGGPGGPMPPSTMAGAATYNTTYNIFDHLAYAMAKNLEQERRFERLESLM